LSITTTHTFNHEICGLERQVGHCKGLIPKFYYDKATKSCEPFNYGGCGGNENNFMTFEECQGMCGTPTNKDLGIHIIYF